MIERNTGLTGGDVPRSVPDGLIQSDAKGRKNARSSADSDVCQPDGYIAASLRSISSARCQTGAAQTRWPPSRRVRARKLCQRRWRCVTGCRGSQAT
jgi:hypothetical protein